MNYDSIIIGAGISGLVTGYRLKRLGQNVLVLENSDRIGGSIRTAEAEGYLIEQGPNSARGTHELIDLIEELDLMGELVTAPPRAPAFVYAAGQLHPVPMGPGPLITSKLLSNSAKLGLLGEPFRAGRTETGEESIASFIRRRLGPQILDRLVAPFLSGVYAGDPEKLSVQACFPRLAEFEASAGSIMRGAIKSARASKGKKEPPKRSLRQYRLCSFRNGLSALPKKLAAALGENLLYQTRVTGITKSDSYQVAIERNHESRTLTCSSLILATPAYTAAQLLESVSAEISAWLAEIQYVSLVSVPLAYRKEQLTTQAEGFGFLAPRSEGLRTLGSIWNSSPFSGRAPDDHLITTNFIGGATDPDAIRLSDEDLVGTVHNDLAKVLGISGRPIRLPITRWERAIPQYNLGHAARVSRIDAALKKVQGLHLSGNYLHGISIGDCIKNAESLADRNADLRSACN